MEINLRQKFTSIFFVILGCVLVGSGPIIIKLYDIKNPFMVVYYRMYIASAVLFGYCIITKTKIKISKNQNMLALVTGLFLAIDLSLYYSAMKYAPISNVSLIGNLSPIFVVGITWLIFKQKPNKSVIFGIFGAVVGLVVLIGFDRSQDSLLGNFIALAAAFFYGIYFLYLAQMIKGIGPLLTNLYITFYCSSFCLFFLLIDNLRTSDELTQATGIIDFFWKFQAILMPSGLHLIGLILNSFCAQIIGQTLVLRGLKNLTPSFGSMLTLFEPVATTVLCSVILFDSISSLQLIGGSIILLSILAVSMDPKA